MKKLLRLLKPKYPVFKNFFNGKIKRTLCERYFKYERSETRRNINNKNKH